MTEQPGPGRAGLLLWPLAWLAGTAVQLQQARLWPQAVNLGLLAAGVAALAVAAWVAGRWHPWPPAPRHDGPAHERRGWAAVGAVALACALLAAATTHERAAHRLAQRLDPALEGQDLQLTGVVARLPQHSLTGTRFVFDVESAHARGQPVVVPPRLSLSWARGLDGDAWLQGADDLRAGQRWRFTARLRQPHGAVNPHGFDAELWLFEQGLRAGGSVRSRAGDPAVKLADDAGYPVEQLRQTLRDRINARVADPAAAGVLAALAIGDQGAIDRGDWALFRVTGVAHLMSISGLHVTLFAWLAGRLVARLWRLHPRLPLLQPAPTAGRWGGLLLAAAYAVLAGWGVPAQRTVVMLAVVVALQGRGRRWPAVPVLLAAAWVVALLDPWALLQPGFWLSFGAVGLLMLSDGGAAAPPPADEGLRARLWRAVRGGLRTQLVATVGLTPLTLVFFQQVSVVGFVANLVAIPLVTLLITPLALAGTLVPLLWQPAAWATAALLQGLALLAQVPGALWSVAAAPAWAGAAGLLGGALLVLPLPWRLRLLGLPLLLPLLAPVVPVPAPGRFELVVADVGQGTAVLVRTQQHLLVYDTGPAWGSDSDAGQRVLVPLLRSRGEAAVHLLMLSHRDTDHVGGAASLLASVPVQVLSTSFDAVNEAATGGARLQPCRAGQRWRWDGVDFELLHPDDATVAAGGRPNTVSCVLRISSPQGSALLTGDIERAQELALVDRLGPALRSDVLLVPHHGSKTSSTDALLDAVAPRVAVVQAAYRSRFGHPAPEVLARYQARGIPVVRTDRCGAWTWRADDGRQTCQRRLDARYWHHPAGLATDETATATPR